MESGPGGGTAGRDRIGASPAWNQLPVIDVHCVRCRVGRQTGSRSFFEAAFLITSELSSCSLNALDGLINYLLKMIYKISDTEPKV